MNGLYKEFYICGLEIKRGSHCRIKGYSYRTEYIISEYIGYADSVETRIECSEHFIDKTYLDYNPRDRDKENKEIGTEENKEIETEYNQQSAISFVDVISKTLER
mgnify:CR=1 FL=1